VNGGYVLGIESSRGNLIDNTSLEMQFDSFFFFVAICKKEAEKRLKKKRKKKKKKKFSNF